VTLAEPALSTKENLKEHVHVVLAEIPEATP
jgi:hypothetical protein